MIQDAIKARLPLISANYRDTINVEEVLTELCGETVKPIPAINSADDIADNTIYYRVASGQTTGESATGIYPQLLKKKSCLIYVNLRKIPAAYHNAGEIPTPKSLIRAKLMAITTGWDEQEAFVDSLMTAVGGMTLKEVVEVFRLTQVRYGGIDAERLAKVRGSILPTMDGMEMVDTQMPVYVPNSEWSDYIESEKEFFLNPADPRLRPRGVLLDGPPGTGKTTGAKDLARKWGVPLFRMDATMNNKYHGESEQNLSRILQQAANEEPCVLLIDEAEKIFGSSDFENGVKSKLLSLLLWFMQESEARVFIIMTTNKKSVLPPELLRPGRLDKQMYFEGLVKADAMPFLKAVAGSFPTTEISELDLQKIINDNYEKPSSTMTQADLSAHVALLAKHGSKASTSGGDMEFTQASGDVVGFKKND